jgi:hypothetical protein
MLYIPSDTSVFIKTIVLINTVVSDGICNIIYDVYAQRDGNHQTINLEIRTIRIPLCV